MLNDDPTPDPLLTPTEVAQLFRVDPKTVTRWANDGRLFSFRTPGGHFRIPTSAIATHLPPERRGQP